MRISKLIVGLFFFAGLAFLGGMVWHVGLADLLMSFRAVGFWIVPLFLLESIPVLLHTAGWAVCFDERLHTVRFWQLCLVRLAGSAVNQMTPTATLGGEVVKVLLLKPLLPREQITASVVIDKASFTLAQMLHLALGILYIIGYTSLPIELQLALGCTIGLISLGLVGFVAFQRYGLLSKLIHRLHYFNIGRARLDRLSQQLAPLEVRLASYYTVHPWRFGGSLVLHFVAFVFGSLQTFVLLRLLLSTNTPSFIDSITVTVAIAALEQAFFFVPGSVGTLEGIRFTVLSVLGVAQVYGLAFGLIARLESLFWSGLGFLAYVICSRSSLFLPPVQSVPRHSTALPPTTC
jgi:uncharacterized protein (TIRG00374 family)